MLGGKRVMQIHQLKILPQYFEPALTGEKTFEIRLNDRRFKIGDWIQLKEFEAGKFTGRYVVGVITYLTDYYQQEGYVVLAYKSKCSGYSQQLKLYGQLSEEEGHVNV